jgi:uncharacterized membrane protein
VGEMEIMILLLSIVIILAVVIIFSLTSINKRHSIDVEDSDKAQEEFCSKLNEEKK